ncbi:hypothetical protein [Chryseobacterium lathyri]|uniref:hypothetical protein n=1 Tax=Chryseobacterium lathyri TaxID=395933 RepID=UPI001CBA9B71|nr:hypothetical protein [Chryseobacterium lathyri]
MKRKNKERLSADKVSYKPDLKDKRVWYGILLGTVVVGIAIERIWRLNIKNNTITDLQQVSRHQDISLHKAKEELIILGKHNASEFVLRFKKCIPSFVKNFYRSSPILLILSSGFVFI